MKIERYKYPLIDFQVRQKALNDEIFRMGLYAKLASSKHEGDREYFKEYRAFVDFLASTDKIPTYLIAGTVSDYLFKNAEPIMSKLWHFIPDIPNQTGCILWREYTYFFQKFDEEGQSVIIYMILEGERGEVGIVIKERDIEGMVRGNPPEESKLKAIGFMLSALFVPFLVFAQCETKIINASKNKKEKIGKEKYITDINSDIQIVDSNWFTTIIRTEGFGVRGHFRLQAIGKERLERKLIWISDFQKHGYTKRARIEIKTAEDTID